MKADRLGPRGCGSARSTPSSRHAGDALAEGPGLLGLLIAACGRATLLGHLVRTVPRFDQLQPAVDRYLDRVGPRVIPVAAGFVVRLAVSRRIGARSSA